MNARQIDKATRGGPDVKRTPRKRNPRHSAVLMADKYASLDTRLDGKCELVGRLIGGTIHKCKGSLVCGHLFSRIAYSTRWDEANLYCICSSINMAMENDPVVAAALLSYAKDLWGDECIDNLHRLYETARPIKTHEIQEIAAIWKEQYEKHLTWRNQDPPWMKD